MRAIRSGEIGAANRLSQVYSRIDHRRLSANLPTRMTRLIGREAHLDASSNGCVARNVRLLTLTGPGGVGKTSLGMAAAGELLPDFADGVFFVALAPVLDPALVPAAIASVMDVRESQQRTALQCTPARPARPPPAAGAGQLRASAARCARRRRIAGRLPAPQGVGDEPGTASSLWRACVPRAAPPCAGRRNPAHDGSCGRIERGTTLCPPRPGRAPRLRPGRLRRLCRSSRFAAGWMVCRLPLNSPRRACVTSRQPELLAASRPGRRHRRQRTSPVRTVLKTDLRNLPERHRSLWDTIAWSYDLLSADEQALFRTAGGLRRRMDGRGGAGSVRRRAGAGGRDCALVAGRQALDPAQRRRRRQAALYDAGDAARVCGRAIRGVSDEVAATQQRMADYFVALAEATDAQLSPKHAQTAAPYQTLMAEFGNMRAVLDWALPRAM